MRQVLVITIIGLFLGFAVGAKDWYETASFYQIYPQTFFDGDDETTFKGTGTFKGIESKLGYLQDLGIDCIWLNPIYKSAYKAFGYDIVDYKELDPRYGTKLDFENLIAAVHARSMKIIVDMVPNHCSNQHPHFANFTQGTHYQDWFIHTDKTNYKNSEDVDVPSNWQRIGGEPGSAWNQYGNDNKFYYAQFSGNMPDFNLRTLAVQTFIQDIMKFWLDVGVDGFRIDAISHGFEAKPNGDGKFENENVTNPLIEDKSDFRYLEHTLTQDQPELFNLIYEWRTFLNTYKTGNTR